MDQWSRLSYLKMYSQQRRAEHYRFIYTWKLLEGLFPNCGITPSNHVRRGRECVIPPLKGRQAVRTLRNQSFQVNGPQLFNSIPKKLREIKKVHTDDFKLELDKYLSTLPDHPKVGDQIPSVCNQNSAMPSNSIIDVIQHKKYVHGEGNSPICYK